MSEISKSKKNGIFNFSKRLIHVEGFERKNVLAHNVGENQFLFLLNKDYSLVKIDLKTGKKEIIVQFDPAALSSTSYISICCSKDNAYLAVTWTRVSVGDDVNQGVVIDAKDGRVQLHLNNGSYYSSLAPFPVCFALHKGKIVVVHATEWDRLDVTDIESGQILTKRNFDMLPKFPETEKFGMTEWPGLIIPSPSLEKVAVQGWVWHPVGIFYSFNLRSWLENNLWESDYIPERKIYAQMADWHFPFCWIDDTKVCISENGFDHKDPYYTSVFNTETGECLLKFLGPTPNVFIYDKFLFSGLKEDDDLLAEGLSIWSIDDGQLLFQQKEFLQIDEYIPESQEFVSLKENGIIELVKWNYTVGQMDL